MYLLRAANLPTVSGPRPWVDVEMVLISQQHPVVGFGIERSTRLIVALAVHDIPSVACAKVVESVLIGAGGHARHVTIGLDAGYWGRPCAKLASEYGALTIFNAPQNIRNARRIADLADELEQRPRRRSANLIYMRAATWARRTNAQLLADIGNRRQFENQARSQLRR